MFIWSEIQLLVVYIPPHSTPDNYSSLCVWMIPGSEA